MDIEQFVLDFFASIGKIDFASVTRYLFIGFGIFWFAIIWWVWFDVSERTTKTWAKIASVVLVTVFNIFGLIIYMVIRPDQTIEHTYWEDLERRYMKYETSELGDCPQCGAQLYPGFVHCPSCGYKLKVKCPKCDVYVDKNYKYCPFCSHQLRERHIQEKVEIQPEVMQEQVQATKEEITEVVESDKTKYSKKESIVTKIGDAVIGGYKIMFDGISDTVKGKGDKKEKGKKKAKK